MYGTTLRLPGEFFDPTTAPSTPDPASYASQLKATMQALRAPPVRGNQPHKIFYSKALDSCTHVFVRHDATRTPLQAVYDGPFRVLDRKGKYFTLVLNGRTDTVSVDRLKPAFMDSSPSQATGTTQPRTSTPPLPNLQPTPAITQPPSRTTRSGRRVHWLDHLNLSFSLITSHSLEGE